MALLFVYGSLRSGEVHHPRLRGAVFVRETRTRPEYELLDLGEFPALVEGGSTAVVGEVYEIDEDHLRGLDEFEGSAYHRGVVWLADGLQAIAYFAERSQFKERPVVAGGDWCRRG